jgi:FkbM family methyltransferase
MTVPYYSQFGQDLWISNEESLKSKKGFFIDVGASHRKNGYMSNTLFLEQAYDWSGILVEPNKKLINDLIKSRQAMLLECAVFNYDGDLFFEKGSSGAGSKVSPYGDIVPCRTLTSILKDSKAPSVIDFLSIDVEGSELEVLDGIDFSLYKFSYIIIESNKKSSEIKNILCSHGYTFIEEYQADLYFSLDSFTNKPSDFLHEWNGLTNKVQLDSYH